MLGNVDSVIPQKVREESDLVVAQANVPNLSQGVVANALWPMIQCHVVQAQVIECQFIEEWGMLPRKSVTAQVQSSQPCEPCQAVDVC
ncbi:hypothetical protein D3C79_658980 [compost metagenome]